MIRGYHLFLFTNDLKFVSMYKYTKDCISGGEMMKKHSLSTWFLFLIPSILGIMFFMVPVKLTEDWKVPIATFADLLSTAVAPIMPWTATIILIIAAIGSVIHLFVSTDGKQPSFVVNLFKVSLFWTITRVIGALFAIATVMQIGPDFIWNENTGGML